MKIRFPLNFYPNLSATASKLFTGMVLVLMLGASPVMSYTVDTTSTKAAVSGLWWAGEAESGWGIGITQQNDIIFATIYTYDVNGNQIWYVASNCAISADACTGKLYAVTGGSELTIPWDAGAINDAVEVGTLTITFTTDSTASMEFVINGASGSKDIQRQIWKFWSADTEGLTGTFAGHTYGIGKDGSEPSTYTQSLSGGDLSMKRSSETDSCTYTGTYSMAGRTLISSGTYSCSDGSEGSYTATNIRITDEGLYIATYNRDPSDGSDKVQETHVGESVN
jgi:hypothetical protein